jgi:hypothetical protein
MVVSDDDVTGGRVTQLPGNRNCRLQVLVAYVPTMTVLSMDGSGATSAEPLATQGVAQGPCIVRDIVGDGSTQGGRREAQISNVCHQKSGRKER